MFPDQEHKRNERGMDMQHRICTRGVGESSATPLFVFDSSQSFLAL